MCEVAAPKITIEIDDGTPPGDVLSALARLLLELAEQESDKED